MRYLFLVSILFITCSRPTSPHMLHIEKRYLLDFPSGSGMVISGDSAYVISDDAPWLLCLSLITREYIRIPIMGADTSIHRIPKPVKPDYEALCKLKIGGEYFLAAFGSGSIPSTRESLLLISLQDLSRQQKIDLSALYKKLKGNNPVINIEGAAANDSTLFLMDRETNQVHQFPLSSFVDYINSGGIQPPASITSRTISLSGSFSTRISGGSLMNNTTLLFCASMEDTPDAIQDGKIHGSYVGLMNTKDMSVLSMFPLADGEGKVLADKLECIDLRQQNTDGSYIVWAIADNDQGNTVLYQLRIYF
jgi:hypothetical protein